MELDYVTLIASFVALSFVFDKFVSSRQYRCYSDNSVPAALAGRISVDDVKKSNAYSIDRFWFGLVSSLVDVCLSLLSLRFNLLRVAYSWAASWGFHSEIVVSLIFAGALAVLSTLVALPFSLYSTFVIEERHGFNKTTLRTFALDFVKVQALTVVLGAPILSLIIWIVQSTGPSFFYYLFGFVLVLQLATVAFLFDWITRCFNKVTSLEDGELRTAINDLCKRVGFNLKVVYKIDSSQRSSHSNAYFFGFGPWKKMVIYDSLLMLEDGTPTPLPDIMAVVGHELTHWRRQHTLKLMAIQLPIMFCFFYALSFFIHDDALHRAFGFAAEKPVIVGLVLFSKLFEPLDMVLEIVLHTLSRRFEYEADEGSAELGYDMPKALALISKQNAMQIHVDPLYSFVNNSHPTIVERIEALQKYGKKQK